VYHREVTEDDIPEVCKLPETREELFYCFPRAAFPLSEAEVRKSIGERSDSTVVEVAGRVVAFANFYRWQEGLCSIGNVVVASEARGSGVGSYLIRHMVKLGFEKHHAQVVSVSCFNRNAAGLLFYPKLGFQPYDVEQRVDYNGDRVALIHLRVQSHAN
jgi:ribosomal protein S18 acetylase RimI-like enzyme